MKILFSSYFFHPSVGGIESVSKILAEKLAAVGNEVHVVTQSDGDLLRDANYQGYVALGTGEYAAAWDLFAESLRRQHTAGNIAGIAEGLNGMAALAVAQGRLERAARLFGAVEPICASNPAPIWPSWTLSVKPDSSSDGVVARLK